MLTKILALSPFSHRVGLKFPIHLHWPMKYEYMWHVPFLDGSFMSQCSPHHALFPLCGNIRDGDCSHQLTLLSDTKSTPLPTLIGYVRNMSKKQICFNLLHYHCCWKKNRYHPKFRGLKIRFLLSHDSVGWPGDSSAAFAWTHSCSCSQLTAKFSKNSWTPGTCSLSCGLSSLALHLQSQESILRDPKRREAHLQKSYNVTSTMFYWWQQITRPVRVGDSLPHDVRNSKVILQRGTHTRTGEVHDHILQTTTATKIQELLVIRT